MDNRRITQLLEQYRIEERAAHRLTPAYLARKKAREDSARKHHELPEYAAHHAALKLVRLTPEYKARKARREARIGARRALKDLLNMIEGGVYVRINRPIL